MKTYRKCFISATIASIYCISSPSFAQNQSGETNQKHITKVESEVIVTAQRREQNLQDVPQSLSVVSDDTLERQQVKSFSDYAKLVPGLNVTEQNPGESRVILRGINTGSAGATVGVYIDDIPFGASGSLSDAGILAGDFDTFDLSRVEVLRGPQGTLYGSNSLGGVIKYVTTPPSTEGTEFRVKAGVEGTEGASLGYSGNALANIPLSENMAVRASGFYRESNGYINAPGRNETDVNALESYGGRVSLLYEPTDDLSLRLFALKQKMNIDSGSTFNVDPETLNPVNPFTGVIQDGRNRFELIGEYNNLNYEVYGGTVNYNLDFATLTSVTSYAKQSIDQLYDANTAGVFDLVNSLYAPNDPGSLGVAFQDDIALKKFTQELRLSSPNSDTFEWQVGGYFTDEKTALNQSFLPFELATENFIDPTLDLGNGPIEDFVIAFIDASYKEYAGFASGTYYLSDRLDVTVGGRYSYNEQKSQQAVIQLGTGSDVTGDSSEGVFTWSIAPRFELSDNLSLYGRAAKGYRPGGPTFIPAFAPPDFPTQFNSDTLVSYEVGIRGQSSNGVFGFDASAYYIDWNDILIRTTVDTPSGPVGINTNGKGARSYGVELTGTLRPTDGLSLIGNFAYTNAKLTDDTIAAAGGANLTGGFKGDRLPYIPEFTGNVSADYEWALNSSLEAFVGGNLNLVGDQPAAFAPDYRAITGDRPKFESYETIDLNVGLIHDKTTLTLYIKNLTNSDGLVSIGGVSQTIGTELGGNGSTSFSASQIRPRTIGATIDYTF